MCNRRAVLKKLFLIFMATAILQACGKEENTRTRPGLAEQLPDAAGLNFLIVSFDALRADAMGAYGYHRDTSPNLDQFARESVLFDNAYTASPTTPTSFAAAFTGQYPYRVFIGWELIPTVTLAGLLQEAGFYTFGLFNNMQLAEERHFNQGFEKYTVGTWPDEKVLADAKKFLDEAADQRFFGWIHFLSPHSPYEYREMSSHLAGPKNEGRYTLTSGGNFDIANEQELKRVRDLYDGEIYFGDDLFRQLMEHVESLGLMDNTVIIVTSDHGEEFMEHGQLKHNAVYEELIRIPLMIRHPGLVRGARSDVPFVNVDLLPTIAAMAGIAPPENIDGIDLFHAFDADRFRLSASMTNPKRYEIANEQLANKLILGCTPEFREELYDLETDPGERSDIILDKPQLAGTLSDAMEDITLSDPCEIMMNAHRGRLPEELLSPEQIEQLRSLGYIQ